MAGSVEDNLKWGEVRRQLKARTPRASLSAANIIIEIAGPLTPRDKGRLRGSAHASQKGEGAELLWSAPYAAPVHEDMTAKHPVGGAKFAERAIKFAQGAARNAMIREL